MAHKLCFEALDQSLRDVIKAKSSSDKIFGGKVMVFGGDFRQILPVIPRGSRSDIVNATINSSYLWNHCHVLTLSKNMHLEANIDATDREETSASAQWILDIGDGIVGQQNDGYGSIEIPKDLLITKYDDPLYAIVNSTFPNLSHHHNNPEYFQSTAILASTNEIVQQVNDYILSLIPVHGGECWTVKLICGIYTHELAKTLVGHPYVGRLTDDEKNIIVDMTKSNVKPRNILLTLKEHNANSCTTIKQIYNARNSTYKTNRYRLPLLDFVGVTPTGMTFSVGFAYLEGERVNNLVWTLERFHIDKNVKEKCKSLIGQKNVWDYVMDSWDNLVDCPSEQEFTEHLQSFQVACSP
ncbi:uncharacterized protein LOC114382659 [Glycine soja]|uniref:uncharacterized protein LOC114382659 n=1 Tax=Glycine soja TaxID=3848 RepID=UPI00103A66A9|nr:uncharacterized protein LOC114382659 [Glycine soja]